MTVRTSLRTIDLARAAGVSVQQVRNYDASGMLPPVERSPSGYRRYTQQHLDALQAARQLIGGCGWPAAQAIMRAVHRRDLAHALALIDERHAELARTREQLQQTLAALGVLASQPIEDARGHGLRRLRVGAAARLAGVRISALRFWEQQGLLHPSRDPGSAYRLYDAQQLRRLRIIALLRQADYDFPAIRATLDQLETGNPQRAVAAIEQRRADLARVSWRFLEGTAALTSYLHVHGGIDQLFCRDS